MTRPPLATAKWISFYLGLCLLLALACNAPIGQNRPPTLSPPNQSPATSPQSSVTAAAPATVPAVGTSNSGSYPPAGTVLPTFTPLRPTLAPTVTSGPFLPGGTSTTTPASSPQTPTPSTAGGPLSFTYTIQWRVEPNQVGKAIATVTITATGGDGHYTYYRDDLPVDGPIFEYKWATCRGNPGSLRVDSGDGQSARTNYFENPPCPITPRP